MCRTRYSLIILGVFFLSFLDTDPQNQNKSLLTSSSHVLDWDDFSSYINDFNDADNEIYSQYLPNTLAEKFLKENIPWFNCPDKELERTFYFRWWTFRKHIKSTPDGYVITEFLPDVPWAGKYNTINCPAGHHFYEGRWLHNPGYLRDYARFWFHGGGSPRSYSFWAANSIYAYACVHRDLELLGELLPHLIKNYESWESERQCEDGLFWQVDGLDGMEVSIGGSGKRATINSYMIGDAEAIARISRMMGDENNARIYEDKATHLRELVLAKLWDEEDTFFKTMFLDSNEFINQENLSHKNTFLTIANEGGRLADVRELHGYTPWYFNIPQDGHSGAWAYLLSPDGFQAPYGPTTAEQSHPGFKVVYEGHECQWNGPSWPFSTSITLKAMANLIRNYNQAVVSKGDFLELLQTYSNSHRIINEGGDTVCWIDENLNPYTGDWISRTMLKERGREPQERGKDYNHSAFCDFIISDLVGIQPSMDDNTLTIHPLVPEDKWDWFCLDRVKYHDKLITVVWDRDGTKYNKGAGFSIFINGEKMHSVNTLEEITIKIK